MKAKRPWKEIDFENWFCKTLTLPSGERVKVITRHASLRRVVDLVALDSEGGLVLLEVKNEAATRAAVGQSLEYLAQYAETIVEDLEDDYQSWMNEDASLADDYAAYFQHPLSLSARRRVFLVAPRFHATASMAAEYLTKLFAHSQVSYHLVEAHLHGKKQFKTTMYKPPIRPARELRGFVANARGRIFYVVESGQTPILWNVGRPAGNDQIKRTRSTALSRRALRWARGAMILLAPTLPAVDLALSGTTWYKPTKPGLSAIQARVIAEITSMKERRVVFAELKDGVWARFRQPKASYFRKLFVQADLDLPDWKTILSQVKQQAN